MCSGGRRRQEMDKSLLARVTQRKSDRRLSGLDRYIVVVLTVTVVSRTGPTQYSTLHITLTL